MHSPDEPLNGPTAVPDDRHALQRAVQARNLYHEGQRLIARAAALAAELAVSVPPGSLSEAFDQNVTTLEPTTAGSSPDSGRLLQLEDALRAQHSRLTRQITNLTCARDLLASGAKDLAEGQAVRARESIRRAAHLMPDSHIISEALARCDTALQATFEFVAGSGSEGGGGSRAAESDADRPVNNSLASARALAAEGHREAAIRMLRDLATEVPAHPGLADELRQLRQQERECEPSTEPAAPIDHTDAVRMETDGSDDLAAAPQTPDRETAAIAVSADVTPVLSEPIIARRGVWMLAAATFVVCVASTWLWLSRTGIGEPVASDQTAALVPVSPETSQGPAGPDAPGNPPSGAPAMVSPQSPTPVDVPPAATGRPAQDVAVAANRERALAVPTGTTVTTAYTQARPIQPVSTMGSDRFLAGRRTDESLLGWRIRSTELERQYRVGKETLARADFSRAIVIFSAVVEDDPDYADAAVLLETARRGRREGVENMIERAHHLRRSGDFSSAITLYRQALALDPSLPEVAASIGDAQRQLADLGERVFKQATVAYAFGLDHEAGAAYAAAARLLPPEAHDRQIAERRAASGDQSNMPLGPDVAEATLATALNLAETPDTLRPYIDAAGRFTFSYPKRKWKVAEGAGGTLASLTESSDNAFVRIDIVHLKEALAFSDHGEAVASVESRLIKERDRAATDVLVRRPRPAVPLVIVDYKSQAATGWRRVRQYSLIRGQDLFRITATAPVDAFPMVEGVFDQVARTFAPGPRR